MLRNKLKLLYTWTAVTLVVMMVIPTRVSGEVKPITEAQEKLAGITEEEQETLKKLFTLTQEIEEMEREENRLNGEIDELQEQVDELNKSIEEEQKRYDLELDLLEQVLISYQRGGPASYLEVLLQSEDLTSFLKNINLVKDITKNTGELLDSIEAGKLKLSEEKEKLAAKLLLVEEKKEELKEPLANKHRLIKEQEAYLVELTVEKEQYQEHLSSLELMWQDLKDMFSGIVDEFSKIISEGYFTIEDLDISFQLFNIKGSVSEDTFNRILEEHSTLPKIIFHFNSDSIVLEVPEKNLILEGSFSVSGSSAILFEPESGSFYGMPLESDSIEELFKEGPLLIDFEAVAGDMVMISINLQSVEAEDGYLKFIIKAGFNF